MRTMAQPAKLPTNATGKLAAILVDLDGCLADIGDRHPIHDMDECEQDDLNSAVYACLMAMSDFGASVVLVTGRFERVRAKTERWLARYSVPYAALYMRRDGDFRKDALVKQELYRTEIEPHYIVIFALDDRTQAVDAWRALDIPCFQVAPGDF